MRTDTGRDHLIIKEKIDELLEKLDKAIGKPEFDEIQLETFYYQGYKSGFYSDISEEKLMELYKELVEDKIIKRYLTQYLEGWKDGRFEKERNEKARKETTQQL
jgi:hypothetical protein